LTKIFIDCAALNAHRGRRIERVESVLWGLSKSSRLDVRRISVLFALLFFSSAAVAAPPKVTISHSPPLDAICALVRGHPIKEEWKEELSKDVKLFTDMWAKIGPELLGTTEKITGKLFTDKDISARLTLCDFPSRSFLFGVSVNMRYALSSFTANPVPMRYKIGVLYHEILHKFLDDHMPTHSALLARHRDESPRVREHLHLLALQKAVYLTLGMKDELAELIDIDCQLPGGFYKRAWEIVNQDRDAYLNYIEELKSAER